MSVLLSFLFIKLSLHSAALIPSYASLPVCLQLKSHSIPFHFLPSSLTLSTPPNLLLLFCTLEPLGHLLFSRGIRQLECGGYRREQGCRKHEKVRLLRKDALLKQPMITLFCFMFCQIHLGVEAGKLTAAISFIQTHISFMHAAVIKMAQSMCCFQIVLFHRLSLFKHSFHLILVTLISNSKINS